MCGRTLPSTNERLDFIVGKMSKNMSINYTGQDLESNVTFLELNKDQN